jgi:hypothetical protein
MPCPNLVPRLFLPPKKEPGNEVGLAPLVFYSVQQQIISLIVVGLDDQDILLNISQEEITIKKHKGSLILF